MGAGTHDNMLAAIGHDLYEDCGCSYEELKQNLGEKPADIIMELSYIPSDTFTKDEYIKSFSQKSIEAYVIKLADRFCNSKDFKMTDLKYAEKYFRKCQCLYDVLEDRKNEIIEKYGIDCFSSISISLNAMESIIKPFNVNLIVPM